MKIYIKVILILLTLTITGCAESSFTLSQDSRLPKWFEVPEGMSRNDLKVTMDYYISGKTIFKLYKKGSFFYLKKVIGITRDDRPLKLQNPPSGFPKNYPRYTVIIVIGMLDIVEHRKLEPVFYMTDDPSIWKELGIKQ